jgi:hypothetical protein
LDRKAHVRAPAPARAAHRATAHRVAAVAAASAAGGAVAACHGSHDRLERLEAQVAVLNELLKAERPDVRVTTGQGDMVFSWDVDLTNCFPEGAKPFERDMHGGFNEDPDTGVVYTGIPGYGLCAISADLRTWTKLGDDERLASNVHGIVVFKHRGETQIAVAQNEAQRVRSSRLDPSTSAALPRAGWWPMLLLSRPAVDGSRPASAGARRGARRHCQAGAHAAEGR